MLAYVYAGLRARGIRISVYIYCIYLEIGFEASCIRVHIHRSRV